MLKAIIIAITLGLATLPAQASVMRAIYTGTAYSAYDDSGVFGSVGALDGMSVKAVFTYDTNGGGRYTGGGYDFAYGGSFFGYPAIMSAKISIGGKTATAAGSYYGRTYNHNDGTTALTAHLAYSYNPSSDYRYIYAYAYDALAGVPVNLDVPYSYAGNNGYGAFAFGNNGGTSSDSASGTFTVDHVSIAPVPLPASLNLAMAALAGLTLMASRRRKA